MPPFASEQFHAITSAKPERAWNALTATGFPWFLDLGVSPDVAPYFGRTGLHWAIPYGHLEVIRLLMERGADPSIRDEFLHADADGWLHVLFATRWHDPVTQQLHELIQSRTR